MKKLLQLKKRWLGASVMALFALFFSFNASAYDFEVYGVYYNIIGDNEVEVTSGDEKYEGNIIIYSEVIKDNIEYSVNKIGDLAFSGCNSLTYVTIPESVISVGIFAFEFCNSLKYINLPESVISIGDMAFLGCESLTNVEIPKSVTEIGNSPFMNCENLESITVDEENPSYASFDGLLYDKNIEILIQCPGAKTEVIIPESVTQINRDAFFQCMKLTSLSIPESVTSLGDETFAYCFALESVIIPESVNEIGFRTFSNCVSLSSVTIPKSVTSLGEDAFESCTSLRSVICYSEEVPEIGLNCFSSISSDAKLYVLETVIEAYRNSDWAQYFSQILAIETEPEEDVTELNYNILSDNTVEVIASKEGYNFSEITIPSTIEIEGKIYNVTSIGENAFNGCTSLVSITLPESITYIGEQAFVNCTSLKSIIIPESVTVIEEGTFNGCFELTSVILPKNINTIGVNAFAYCHSLESINIPAEVTTIGNSAFTACYSITSINIPETLNKIGYGVFSYCSSLTSITIPESVTYIDGWAFASCSSLSKVNCEAVEVPELGEVAFTNIPSDAILYVPAESVEAYKASDWAQWFSQILPISDEPSEGGEMEPGSVDVAWMGYWEGMEVSQAPSINISYDESLLNPTEAAKNGELKVTVEFEGEEVLNLAYSSEADYSEPCVFLFGEEQDNDQVIGYYILSVSLSGMDMQNGEYTVTIPAGLVQDEAGNVNPEQVVVFNYVQQISGDDAVINPEPSQAEYDQNWNTYYEPVYSADDLIHVTISWEGYAMTEGPSYSSTITAILAEYGEQGGAATEAQLYPIIDEDTNEIVVDLSGLEVGVWQFSIPQGYVYLDGTSVNGVVDLTYYIDQATGIADLIKAESYDVYTINGVKVISNGSANSLSTLAPGLYIINGKKVVVK